MTAPASPPTLLRHSSRSVCAASSRPAGPSKTMRPRSSRPVSTPRCSAVHASSKPWAWPAPPPGTRTARAIPGPPTSATVTRNGAGTAMPTRSGRPRRWATSLPAWPRRCRSRWHLKPSRSAASTALPRPNLSSTNCAISMLNSLRCGVAWAPSPRPSVPRTQAPVPSAKRSSGTARRTMQRTAAPRSGPPNNSATCACGRPGRPTMAPASGPASRSSNAWRRCSRRWSVRTCSARPGSGCRWSSGRPAAKPRRSRHSKRWSSTTLQPKPWRARPATTRSSTRPRMASAPSCAVRS